MKICIFAPVKFYSIGGRVQRIVSYLQKNHCIIWVDPLDIKKNQKNINQSFTTENIELIISPSIKGNIITKTLQKEIYYLNICKNVKDIDICIFYVGGGTFFARHYLRKKKVTLIFDYVDKLYLFESNPFQKIAHKWLEHEAMKMCDAVICSAHLLAEEAQKYNSNVYRISNGASIKLKVQTYSIHHPSVGFIGGIFKRWLDIEMVEQAVNALLDVHFYFVGEGDLTDRFDLLSKNNQNFHMIRSVPYEDVYSWINAFDICMIPFKINELSNAISPLKLFEYWAVKKPVIATPTYEMKKIVDDEIIFVNNTNELITAISNLLNNKDIRLKLGKAGYNKLKNHYEWDALSSDYLNAIYDVLKKILNA